MKTGGERGGKNRQSFFQWAGAEGERERAREGESLVPQDAALWGERDSALGSLCKGHTLYSL